jgi:hypothetical protein
MSQGERPKVLDGMTTRKELAAEIHGCERTADNLIVRLGLQWIKAGRERLVPTEVLRRRLRGEPESRRRGRKPKSRERAHALSAS